MTKFLTTIAIAVMIYGPAYALDVGVGAGAGVGIGGGDGPGVGASASVGGGSKNSSSGGAEISGGSGADQIGSNESEPDRAVGAGSHQALGMAEGGGGRHEVRFNFNNEHRTGRESKN